MRSEGEREHCTWSVHYATKQLAEFRPLSVEILLFDTLFLLVSLLFHSILYFFFKKKECTKNFNEENVGSNISRFG